MAMVDWIDALALLWELDYQGGTKQLKTYRLFDRDEFPETLDVPCVLTWPQQNVGEYSKGQTWSLTTGISEFHLAPSPAKTHYPFILSFWDRIIEKASTNIGLNNTAKIQFYLDNSQGSRIQGPVGLQYGDEIEHGGLVVRWSVYENTAGAHTVALE